MYRSTKRLLEDIYDTIAGNTDFCTPEGFRCNISDMVLDYDNQTIVIDSTFILSITKIDNGKKRTKNGKHS